MTLPSEKYAVSRARTIQSPVGGIETVAYELTGQRTVYVDALNHTTNYGNNTRSWRTTATKPLGQTVTTAYGSAGNPTSVIDAWDNRTTAT